MPGHDWCGDFFFIPKKRFGTSIQCHHLSLVDQRATVGCSGLPETMVFLVDVSNVVVTVHQMHGYGQAGRDEEMAENARLAGSKVFMY